MVTITITMNQTEHFAVSLSLSLFQKTGTGGPSEVREGRDALLTCVVMAPYYNDTIIWRKGPREILSAGMNRVTSDKRISILHEDCEWPSTFPALNKTE